MLDEEIRALKKAGYIARVVLEGAVKFAKPGVKLLDLAEYVEGRIRELGGDPAFPVNIGINNVAAHYTPVANDDAVVLDNSIVKIDVGVHVDGYIADTAVTICFNPMYEALVDASRFALEKVIEVIKPNVRVNVIGKVIEESIKSRGFKVIKNLSGHSIGRYRIHGGLSIPNFHDLLSIDRLGDGVYAIEPFATNGAGFVVESNVTTIYALKEVKNPKLRENELKLYDTVWCSRRTLPFAERWLLNLYGSHTSLKEVLSSLIQKKVVHQYPVLLERAGGFVSQFEHTFVVSGKDVYVTTLKNA